MNAGNYPCATPGCRENVAYSDYIERHVQLCQKHLDIHRRKYAQTSIDRKRKCAINSSKLEEYDGMCEEIADLQLAYDRQTTEYAKLKQAYHDLKKNQFRNHQRY